MGGQAWEKQRSCTQGRSVFCLSLDPDLFFLSSGGIPPVSSEQGKVNVASPQFPRHPTGQRAGSHLGSKDPSGVTFLPSGGPLQAQGAEHSGGDNRRVVETATG